MILYFSGTGNSEYVAHKIGKEIQDEVLNLFEKIRSQDYSSMHSEKPWIIISPTYAWRIPRILQNWLENTKLNGSSALYFIMTCDGNICNAGAYLQKLCSQKGMDYQGCNSILMPENYIALFSTPKCEEALLKIKQADKSIEKVAGKIKRQEPFPPPSPSLSDKINSGIVNDIFYPLFVHAKKFYATDACISCKKCEAVCPLKNIRMHNGRPVWGKSCTHCMACISRCPSAAIEYVKHSKGQVRYTCPKITE